MTNVKSFSKTPIKENLFYRDDILRFNVHAFVNSTVRASTDGSDQLVFIVQTSDDFVLGGGRGRGGSLRENNRLGIPRAIRFLERGGRRGRCVFHAASVEHDAPRAMTCYVLARSLSPFAARIFVRGKKARIFYLTTLQSNISIKQPFPPGSKNSASGRKRVETIWYFLTYTYIYTMALCHGTIDTKLGCLCKNQSRFHVACKSPDSPRSLRYIFARRSLAKFFASSRVNPLFRKRLTRKNSNAMNPITLVASGLSTNEPFRCKIGSNSAVYFSSAPSVERRMEMPNKRKRRKEEEEEDNPRRLCAVEFH